MSTISDSGESILSQEQGNTPCTGSLTEITGGTYIALLEFPDLDSHVHLSHKMLDPYAYIFPMCKLATNTIPCSSLTSLVCWYRFCPCFHFSEGRIIESFKLEKTFKIIESNHQELEAQLIWALRTSVSSQNISIMYFSLLIQYGDFTASPNKINNLRHNI